MPNIQRYVLYCDYMHESYEVECSEGEWVRYEDCAALEAKLETAIEALAWYGLHAAGCRMIHREGDGHRIALSEDGGAKARATLAEISK